MTRSRVHHFPKWLLSERFDLTYEPSMRPARFRVELSDGTYLYWGHGSSIAAAAKEAIAKRDKWTVESI